MSLRKKWTDNRKKTDNVTISKIFFIYNIFNSFLFSEMVENYISNRMHYENFQSDKNNKFLHSDHNKKILILSQNDFKFSFKKLHFLPNLCEIRKKLFLLKRSTN